MRCAKHQPRCSVDDCTTPAKIDWKDDPRHSDTWCFCECAKCWAPFCEDHCETGTDPYLEEVGEDLELWCIDCVGQAHHEELKPPARPDDKT